MLTLFGISRKARMRLTVQIESGSGFYHPGDLVSGRATISGPLHDNKFQITVRFEGQAVIVYHKGESRTRRSHTLCQLESMVFEGPCHLSCGERKVFHFHFRLPKRTLPISGQKDTNVWTDRPHVLPPSIGATSSKGSCWIEYSVTFKAKRSCFWRCNAKVKKGIDVVRRPKSQDLFVPQFKRMTHALYTRVEPPSSMLERMRLRETEGEAKMTAVTIRARLPSTMQLNHPASLWLEWIHDKHISTMEEIPTVKLKKVEHTIFKHTWFRVRGSGKECQQHIQEVDRCYVPCKETEVMLQGQFIDIGPVLSVLLSQGPDSEGFRSYGIGRSYSAETKVTVEVAGKEHTFVWKMRNLIVFPRAAKQLTEVSTDGDE